MRFLADVGISPIVVQELQQQGHNAIHLFDEALERLPDHEILAKARRESRIVLTHDLDFGDLLAASGEDIPSVIIFRLNDMRPANVSRHLEHILFRFEDALGSGVVVSVGEKRVRIRSLPIG